MREWFGLEEASNDGTDIFLGIRSIIIVMVIMLLPNPHRDAHVGEMTGFVYEGLKRSAAPAVVGWCEGRH
jgi:hypothetical protein